MTLAAVEPPSGSPCPPPQSLHTHSAVHAPSSIFITFKVAQLVNSFRRRVKTRLVSRAAASKTTVDVEQELCQEFEKEAFEEIDRYLGRSTAHGRRKCHSSGKISKSKTVEYHTVDRDASHDTQVSIEGWRASFTRLLAQFDAEASSKEDSLINIANDDRLLLEPGYKVDINLHCLSQKELASLLSLVQRLLATINYAQQHSFGGGRLIVGGKELDVDMDESFLANLEHCLLCLQTELVRALFNHGWSLVQKHVIESQKQQHRKCEDWFSEFPNARHPLSTTWPWSIRPSLAVLWGVCWMFYPSNDEDGYTWDAAGNFVRQDGHVVMSEEDYWQDLGTAIGATPANASALTANPNFAAPHQAATIHPTAPPYNNVYQSPASQTYVAAAQYGQLGPNQVPRTLLGHAYEPNEARLLGHRQAQEPLHFKPSSTSNDGNAWFPDIQASTSYPPNSAALNTPGSRGGVTPTIRLITDLPPATYYETSIYPQYPGLAAPSYSTAPPGTLSPQDLIMSSPPSPHTPQHNPRSPHNRDSSSGPSHRSRTHSIPSDVSRGSSLAPDRSPISAGGQSPKSPVPSRGRPPKNELDKYTCNHAECSHFTFDRKCEWSKHMDKHERPYRCADPACNKLQGFTYSGGLLRHEREVHHKHGGPKEQLHCPVTTCKRYNGTEFTRKENYNEHMRRVHGQRPDSIPTAAKSVKDEDGEVDSATPFSERSEAVGTSTTAAKRKRSAVIESSPAEAGPETDKEELRGEIKRLKLEMQQMKEKFAKMEKAKQ